MSRNFEGRVQENKKAANKALTLAGQIEDTIQQAVEKTAEVSELLQVRLKLQKAKLTFPQDTDKDSQLALNLAQEARDMAGKASAKVRSRIQERDLKRSITGPGDRLRIRGHPGRHQQTAD